MYLPGGSYLFMPNSTDFDFGSGNFTIDWWEYRTAASDQSCFVRRSADTNPQAFLLGYSSAGNWLVYMSSNNSTWDIASGVNCGALQYNVWNHFAVVRNGNTFLVFKNGTQVATWTSALPLYTGNGGLYFGPWTTHYQGYMDQIRFSKGVARWVSNFSPPTTPYGPIPDYSQYHTVLLLHGDGTPGAQTFPDSSVYAKGNAGVAGVSQISGTAKFGQSLYVDYNSSYFYFGNSEDFNFGYGDLTIDWWDYRLDGVDSRPTLVRDSGQLVYQPFLIGYASAGTLYAYGSNDQASWNVVGSLNLGPFTPNVWSHRALVRKGTTFYGFKDGILQSTQASSQPFPSNSGAIIWGYWNTGGYNGGYQCMDEFRIVKGKAMWTANFTPPTAPYT
jgi:hypothetical protein